MIPLTVRAEAERERRRRRAAQPPVWSPYPDGPQERAYHSEADITGYGGAAGGGKSDLALGLALTRHRRSIIFRREFPQNKGLIDRSREIIDDKGRFNGKDNVWRLDDGRMVEFGACQYPEDKNKYRGRPHDLLVVDEATEFLEQPFRFLMGWMRTTDPDQRCRALLTFNPPTNSEGEWVVRFFAAWLDEEHHSPAMPGELRWYATVDGKEIERPDGQAFAHFNEAMQIEETIRPMSRTFFPAKLADNPALANTNYGANLQSLPEPLRSQLLFGDFKAGIEPDAWQVIPTRWIKAAIERWKATPKPDLKMTMIGMDVAHGGKDKTVFAPRHGHWFAPLVSYPGVETPDGKTAAALAVKVYEDNATINVDAIGYGASAAERLKDKPPDGYGISRAVAINVSNKSHRTDRSGKYKMINLRAEMHWRLREALDPDNEPTLCLPDDPEMVADLTAPRYEITTAGIKIESKPEIKDRINRSPDKGDAVALAMLPGPALFEIHQL
jgi:hypothetical protein